MHQVSIILVISQSKLTSPSLLPPHIRGLATPDAHQEIDILWMERVGNLLHCHIGKRGMKRRGRKRQDMVIRKFHPGFQGPEELCVILCRPLGLLC